MAGVACELTGRDFPAIAGCGAAQPAKGLSDPGGALKIVRQSHDARLLILGEGEDRLQLERLVKELCLEDCVSMPGIARNPYAYMARRIWWCSLPHGKRCRRS